MDTSNPLLTYWYFHLPNFSLKGADVHAAWRALLGLIVQPI